jgi:hypothetical protein
MVQDSEGASIAGALIMMHWDPSGADVGVKDNVGIRRDLTARADSKGHFRVALPAGFYDVFISATAFTPNCRKIRLKPNENASFAATLVADPLVTKELGDEVRVH